MALTGEAARWNYTGKYQGHGEVHRKIVYASMKERDLAELLLEAGATARVDVSRRTELVYNHLQTGLEGTVLVRPL